MGNQQQDPTERNQSQGSGSETETRQRQGGEKTQSQSHDRSTEESFENPQKPGDADADAAQGINKSTNGDEFDREGRNPKPFSVN